VLELLDLPMRLMSWAMIARRIGTQMEFVIQKAAGTSEAGDVQQPEIEITVGSKERGRAAA
jgi:hypothetical protein